MRIRAVIFDYGMVLSGPPDLTIQAELVRRMRVSPERAEALYRKHRRAYDRGDLDGMSYWRLVFAEADQLRSEAEIAETAVLDARMWTVEDRSLVGWQARLKASGVKTAILSNMGDLVRESIERSFPWVQHFDERVWSYELGVLKPEPAIYREALRRLGTKAEETLFLDDVAENVEGARRIGIQTVQYKNVSALRDALAEGDFGLILPEFGSGQAER